MKSPNHSNEQRITKPCIRTNSTLKRICQLLLCALIVSTGCVLRHEAPIDPSNDSSSSHPESGKLRWKVQLDSRQLGPLETYLHMDRQGDAIYGYSPSGILDTIGSWSRETDRSPASIFSFQVTRDPSDANRYTGALMEPWEEDGVTLEFQGDTFSGSVNHWLLGGDMHGEVVHNEERIRDYRPVLDAFDQVVHAHVFDPKMLDTDAYHHFRQRLDSVVTLAQNDFDMTLGFHFAWNNDPFSHFQLRRSVHTSRKMFESFDHMRMGYEAARVRFEGDLAILRVDTMMGQDTIEQIESAYQQIHDHGSKGLIIDLRGNGGGAFAVKPLVEHIIDAPFDAGYFLSRPWYTQHADLPTLADMDSVPAWEGWSISSFWQDVQRLGVMKLRFEPAKPHFEGPVVVLVDSRSASATELAADAFRISGRATLIGEQTAGEMLSQSFFDLIDGYIISLPVADYFSMKHGRIEGKGVPVDVPCASEEAFECAKRFLK